MLNKYIDTEIEYVKLFSERFENKDIIRFWDNSLEGMYSHNFTYINNNTDSNRLRNLILNELQLRQLSAKSFLQIACDFNISKELISSLPIAPVVSSYDYMYIETEKYTLLKGNPNCSVTKADTAEKLRDGMNVDILANEGGKGSDFARKRINRKSEMYKIMDSNLDLYVCYNNDRPIGNCELFINDKVGKIEDFDILEQYQKRGFGTTVLKHLLKELHEKDIEIAYLITDSSDTAKEMYKKCGFSKVGVKTELFFRLTDSDGD
ncbi:GNAT family N-acetyltransferase [Wukongibacter baidiensis]|uniref:GNAT family N-acetyltransferase n=1 Tax=Wukongibacter baidiensis TaxID=1723361 RepID=UPI003D7F67D6